MTVKHAEHEPILPADASVPTPPAGTTQCTGTLPLTTDADFFWSIIHSLREALFVTDLPSRQLLYVNPAFERLFGFTVAQARRDPGVWRHIVDPADVEYLSAGMSRLESGEATRPFRVLQADGSQRWVRLRQFPQANAQGQIERVTGLIEDIGEEQRHNEMARERKDSLQRIIEALPVGIVAYREGRVVFVNSALSRLLETPAEELLKTSMPAIIDEFFVKSERPLGLERLAQARTGRDLPPVERQILARSGELRNAELQTMTVNFDGEPAQITVVRDLTEQRRLEAQVAQTDRMATVGRIAAGVAHELNNPLSYVLGNLEMAREELPEMLNLCAQLQARVQTDADLLKRAREVTERLNKLVGVIRDASEGADRVRGIMRDLKSFSRPDADDRREVVEIARPLDAAVRMAWREIQPRARLVQVRDPIPQVLGIEGRLCQVFLNLLINAAEALPDGESHAHELKIRTCTSPLGEAIVEVTDDGPGINARQLPHLFEPFFTTKAAGRGTGLGLSICQDIVHAHGGRIEVESQLGHGALFRVVLPPATAPRRLSRPQLQVPLRRGKILIVDDEPHVASTLRQCLGRDHDAVVVESGKEALDLIANGERFDVIFCDLMMPVVSGMDVHATMLAMARDQSDRIVFMTGGVFSPVVREFLTHVPNRCLEKPFALREVREAVADLLQ